MGKCGIMNKELIEELSSLEMEKKFLKRQYEMELSLTKKMRLEEKINKVNKQINYVKMKLFLLRRCKNEK